MQRCINILLLLLTTSINAMDEFPLDPRCKKIVESFEKTPYNQIHQAKIPSLKELCLPVIPEVIAKKCRLKENTFYEDYSEADKQKIGNVMQQIPRELHQPIISACLLPNFKKKPETVVLDGTFRNVSPNHTYICLALDKTLSILDTKQHYNVVKRITCNEYCRSAVFSEDSNSLAYLSLQSLSVYDLVSEQNKKVINNLPLDLFAFNNVEILAANSGKLSLWNFKDDMPSSRIHDLTFVKKSVFCTNNRLAFIKWANKCITILDIDANTLKILKGHTDDDIHDLKSHNKDFKTTLASASKDKTIRIWNIDKTGGDECIAILPQLSSAMDFNPDGTLLIASYDKTMYLWNIATQECIASYTDQNIYPIHFISWAHNGSSIIITHDKDKPTYPSTLYTFNIPYAALGNYLAQLKKSQEDIL